ncbi:Uncharacterised protein [uncultured archaeon]|nr:Uncharacterised protein [uncultured archaeon]
MGQFKSIILITVIGLAVLLSGCTEKPVGTPTPVPAVTATTTATPVITAVPEATPTGISELVGLNNRRGFIPDNQTINPGDEIVWENEEVDAVTLVSKEGVFDAQFLTYQKQYRYVFKRPGTYSFYFEENNSLIGTIIVESMAATPQPTPSVPAIKQLPSDALYVIPRMQTLTNWSSGGVMKYELRLLKVEIHNQLIDTSLSIKAQVVSDGQVLEENSFTLEKQGSSYEFTNQNNHFINSTNVTLRLLIAGYQPVEYKFEEVENVG